MLTGGAMTSRALRSAIGGISPRVVYPGLLALSALATFVHAWWVWPRARPEFAARVDEACRIWGALVDGGLPIPRISHASGAGLLEAVLFGIGRVTGGMTGGRACAGDPAGGSASSVWLYTLAIALLCASVPLCCARVARAFTGSRRAALLAAGLALAFGRLASVVAAANLDPVMTGGLIILASSQIAVASLRRQWLGLAAGGALLVVAAATWGQIELSVVLIAAIAVGAGGLAGHWRKGSRAPAARTRLACMALALGIATAAGLLAALEARAFGSVWPVSDAELARTNHRVSALRRLAAGPDVKPVGAGTAIPDSPAGPVESLLHLIGQTGQLMMSAPTATVARVMRALVRAIWDLGGILSIACVCCLRASLRIARARDQLFAWLALMLPIAFLGLDGMFGFGLWWSTLSVTLPIVVVPSMIWRGL